MQTQLTYAGGFLYNPDTKEILLHLRDNNTKYDPGLWSFFGGLCEGDETPAQGFVRELKEELGIDILVSSVKHLRTYLVEELQTIRHVYYAESGLPKSAMTLGEGADFDWVPLDKVLDLGLAGRARGYFIFFIEKGNV